MEEEQEYIKYGRLIEVGLSILFISFIVAILYLANP